MAQQGAAPTDISRLATEAEQLAKDAKSLRGQTRQLAQRAAALRDSLTDKLSEAGIGFKIEGDANTTAREGEGDRP